MARRKFRPARVFVRRPTVSHVWEVAQHTTTCELRECVIHRGTLLVVKTPGRVRACRDCADRSWGMKPPADLVDKMPDLWTGRDGREARIPESDR